MVAITKENGLRKLALKKAALAEAQRTLARREREDGIRRQSATYGAHWCAEHAATVGIALAAAGDAAGDEPTRVRVYDRAANAMRDTTLGEVLGAIREAPPLRPTAFGQVALAPNLHVSAAIYQLVVAVREALASPRRSA